MRKHSGFTLIELVATLAVTSIMTAIAVPSVRSALKHYHVSSAASAAAGAISSTRYQAIVMGCPYQVVFAASKTTYQVKNEALSGNPPACAAAFANVGGAISWSGSGDVSISPSTTLQFNPNGTVSATAGSLSFTMTSDTFTEAITVSGVGNVSVTP